jgi:hypothetical protein
LTQCKDDEANEAERYWIKFFDSKNDELGYNLTDGGDGVIGHKCSEETKRRISLANHGKVRSSLVREKISSALMGHINSEETRKKISQKLKGHSTSNEHRCNLSKALKGKKHSKEHNDAISKSHSGMTHTEETRRKISASQRKHVIDHIITQKGSHGGSNNPRAKVNEDDVREIRRRFRDEGAMIKDIMDDYDLSRNATINIKLYTSWKHVE